jgi:hypothetical protein
VARIQFRLPNGVTKNHKFSPDEHTIADLYKFVIEEMETPYGSNVSLSTTFPSRDLDSEPKDATLRDSRLVPSTTVLVLPRSRGTLARTSGSPGEGIFAYLWLCISTFFGWILGGFMGGGGGNQEASAARPRPSETSASTSYSRHQSSSSRAYKRIRTEGNIASLSSNEDNDDEDNNTYNGNSTQQM